MYDISMPIVVTSECYNSEEVLQCLKRAGAKRVMLAIGAQNFDDAVQAESFRILEKENRFFQERGYETFFWTWSFWLDDAGDAFTPIQNFSKEPNAVFKCPADERYIAFAQKRIAQMAAMHPNGILLDDDYRFGYMSDNSTGCCCEHHMKLYEQELGYAVDPDDILPKYFSGKPCPERTAILKMMGQSMVHFAGSLRSAIDSVAPEVRLGVCLVSSLWDADGVDCFTVARALAGKNTRPFLRLSGAPYWVAGHHWEHHLPDVIELPRLARSWDSGTDVEVVIEGDTYPRPNYIVPASYLEIFDTALRADGRFDGILKYNLNYTSRTDYDTSYLNAQDDHVGAYAAIDRMFGGKTACGVRVYETMQKLKDFDFTDTVTGYSTKSDPVFPHASRFLVPHGIPTVFEGDGCGVGIAFGENARALPEKAFDHPLILDLPAARILTGQGIDVGLVSVGERETPRTEWFIDEKNVVAIETSKYATGEPGDPDYAFHTVLKENARVLSLFNTEKEVCFGEGAERRKGFPSAYTYENAAGMKFLVYTFDGRMIPGDVRRNYSREKQLLAVLREFGVSLPAAAPGHPNLYLLCKQGENELTFGLWNCFADYAKNFTVQLGEKYSSVECFGCNAQLTADGVQVDYLAAYDFCFITVKK